MVTRELSDEHMSQNTLIDDTEGGSFDASGPRAPSGLSLPGRVAEFGREIRAELRQVAWPTRSEVVSAATVVLIVLVLLTAAIFGLNWIFSHAVTDLLKT